MSFQPHSGMDSGTPRPCLRAGEKGERMRKTIPCEFNIDTACVELRYADGSGINIYCPSVEDSFDTTLSMRTEMDRLIVCRDGTV